jgi:DNA mismatch repair protein MutS
MTKLSPMMQQYMDCKRRYPDAVLFFRLGDFYEMFYEDAEVVARELGLTLTSRNKQAGEGVPMAGVPVRAHQQYVAQLIDKGFTVAIAEQLEDASKTKGMVDRDVVRVVTPGVVLDTDNLDAKASNYVGAIDTLGDGSTSSYGLAYLDVSTGDLRATEVSSLADLLSELGRAEVRELLVPEYADGLQPTLAKHLPGVFIRAKHRDYFSPEGLLRAVSKGPRLGGHMQQEGYFHGADAVARVLAGARSSSLQAPELVASASAAVLRYVVKTQRGIPSHVRPVETYRSRSFLVIDESTKANLELTETLMGGRRSGSLLSVIDKTVTAMGGRRLRQWLNYPLVDLRAISARHDAVAELISYPAVRQDIRAALDQVYDIERLCGRVSSGSANAKDLRALLSTLEQIPQVQDILADCACDLLVTLHDALDPCEELCALIERALVEEPPTALTEGGMFKLGYDDELDELIDLSVNGKDWMLRYEAEQRQATGISSLKVKFNKNFGYFVEVTKANLDQVPDDYVRRQTLTNAERYTTEELSEMAEKILNAEELRQTLEYSLFEDLRATVGGEIARLMRTASELSNLDVVSGLAELAQRREYCRPEMTDAPILEIEDGRHPVVENSMRDGERFVPNDVALGPDRRVGVITGPNMAGKSTVIRQVALISLLAQIGSFVPASAAKLGVVDKIFSRVGASDNLAKGQSTFMVEMTETAHILNNATDRSLIILDEIGRGTATFDGLSIAWAVVEHMHDVIGGMTLFATHYHELTELARTLDASFNMSIAVKEWQDDIIFLRKLVDGPANRSYGIQVGRLAGLPDGVVGRAKEILAVLEAGHFEELQSEKRPAGAPSLGAPAPAPAPAHEGVSVAQALGQSPKAPARPIAPAPETEPAPAPEPAPGAEPVAAGAPEAAGAPDPRAQLSLFGSGVSRAEEEVLASLRDVSIGHMTPLEALNLLDKLSRQLRQ